VQFYAPVLTNNLTGFAMPEQVHDPPESEWQRLRRTDPENYGPHKCSPSKTENWYEWNKRRMKGEQFLLSMMDVNDRLQWFESKSVCIQYPQGGDYGGRVLYIHPRGRFEFSRDRLRARRNIWLADDDRLDRWSYEDMIITMIMHFQMDPQHFIYHVGCRDCVGSSDYKYQQIVEDYLYGYRLRQEAAKRRKKRDNCATFMNDRRLPDASGVCYHGD
jgi:hypothetical protein